MNKTVICCLETLMTYGKEGVNEIEALPDFHQPRVSGQMACDHDLRKN
jgi:hypothetical protein